MDDNQREKDLRFATFIVTGRYYARLVIWVAILLFLFQVMKITISVTTIGALSQIILFVVLLGILVLLKLYRPDWYQNFRWFCLPGIIFLKSWTSLFFFAYLIQLPAELSSVSAPQIVSWVSQIFIGNERLFFLMSFLSAVYVGNIVALIVPVGLLTGTNYVMRMLTKTPVKEEAEPSGESRQSTVILPALQTYDLSTSGAVEEAYLGQIMTRSSVFATDGIGVMLFSDSAPMDMPAEDPSPSFFPQQGSASQQSAREATAMEAGGERPSQPSMAISRRRFVAEIRNSTQSQSAVAAEDKHLRNTLDMKKRMGRESEVEMVGAASTTNSMHEQTSGPLQPPSSTPSPKEAGVAVVPLPFIPDMLQLTFIWLRLTALFAVINILCPFKSPSAVVGFQISSCTLLFILSTFHRLKIVGPLPPLLQTLLPSPVLFTPPAILLVVLSSSYTSEGGILAWQNALDNFIVDGTILSLPSFGAGNYLTILLNPAIISLAWAAVEPLLMFSSYVPRLVPILTATCLLIYLIAALISLACQSPAIIALPLLVHCVTTPIALAISEITGGSAGITAASTILNGLLALKLSLEYLDRMGIMDPATRGVSAGVAGTLLGVVALDERKEEVAAGIGMVGYSIATVLFAVLMAITPLQEFLVNLS